MENKQQSELKSRPVKIIECPRDAMQGLLNYVPTETKVSYIQQLLTVGFDTIDFGSFVSPTVIPQMADTHQVIRHLDGSDTDTHLLAIVANLRGAKEASTYEAIRYIGFPLSVSETFQRKNTGKTISQALSTVADIQDLCHLNKKTQVVYLSMGFGNPYGDLFDVDMVIELVTRLSKMGIQIISLADTIGISTPALITEITTRVLASCGEVEIGLHLHSLSKQVFSKIEAAYEAGCRRFDGTIKGYGGCPMASDHLIGNIPTESIIDFLQSRDTLPALNQNKLFESFRLADQLFGNIKS